MDDFALYYVDSEGNRLKVKLISVGSGSTFAYSIIDSSYSWNISIEGACDIGNRAIFQAIYKDPYSGGSMTIYLIRREGWIKISCDFIDFNIFTKYSRK